MNKLKSSATRGSKKCAVGALIEGPRKPQSLNAGYQMQVQLLAVVIASTCETRADEEERGLFRCWQPKKMVDSCPKHHHNICGQAAWPLKKEGKEVGTCRQ